MKIYLYLCPVPLAWTALWLPWLEKLFYRKENNNRLELGMIMHIFG
ncbi:MULTISPECIES: hypothetical protein [unclassified Siphonobacter]|nr:MULTISPECIES: hypothetical protein [unclassified Siphonobacter]MDQ1087951.1 hypothetical protein [Siphonobacter sp. SORGH_AS_1065]MDR6194097.1 hypothetical protein [Siphonobacter sp. SORGH_AS_0500]